MPSPFLPLIRFKSTLFKNSLSTATSASSSAVLSSSVSASAESKPGSSAQGGGKAKPVAYEKLSAEAGVSRPVPCHEPSSARPSPKDNSFTLKSLFTNLQSSKAQLSPKYKATPTSSADPQGHGPLCASELPSLAAPHTSSANRGSRQSVNLSSNAATPEAAVSACNVTRSLQCACVLGSAVHECFAMSVSAVCCALLCCAVLCFVVSVVGRCRTRVVVISLSFEGT